LRCCRVRLDSDWGAGKVKNLTFKVPRVLSYFSSMGTIARYLVPIDSGMSAAEYGDRARQVLLLMEVISESPDDNNEVLHHGERSTEPFQMEPGDEPFGFDMAGSYAGPGFTIAPEEYVDGVSCPKCDADLTEEWAPKMRDEEGRKEYDSPDVSISCPKCGAVCRLDEVKGGPEVKFYLTDRFVSFWDCRPFKPEWIAEFDRQMGCHHETFDYGWT